MYFHKKYLEHVEGSCDRVVSEKLLSRFSFAGPLTGNEEMSEIDLFFDAGDIGQHRTVAKA